MNLADNLKLATDAALAAGAKLAEIARGTELAILSDTGHDIKMQADQDAERVIIDMLRAGSPHPILAEESGEHGVPAGGPFWVIDPLDGTMNFSRAIPLCCVSIGLIAGERPLLGVIYDFYRDELFSGAPETGGRFISGNAELPLKVSDVRETRRAILSTGFPSYRDFSDQGLQEFVARVQNFKKVRMLGSAALMMAYVACGRFDAYTEDDIFLWDVAAGMALIEAAGGSVELRPSAKSKWARHVKAAAHPQSGKEQNHDRGETGTLAALF